jgi:hypothetical protein
MNISEGVVKNTLSSYTNKANLIKNENHILLSNESDEEMIKNYNTHENKYSFGSPEQLKPEILPNMKAKEGKL